MEASLIQGETVIVPSQSILDQIYEALKERILLGRIAPGERIIESTVAKDFIPAGPLFEVPFNVSFRTGWWNESFREVSGSPSSPLK